MRTKHFNRFLNILLFCTGSLLEQDITFGKMSDIVLERTEKVKERELQLAESVETIIFKYKTFEFDNQIAKFLKNVLNVEIKASYVFEIDLCDILFELLNAGNFRENEMFKFITSGLIELYFMIEKSEAIEEINKKLQPYKIRYKGPFNYTEPSDETSNNQNLVDPGSDSYNELISKLKNINENTDKKSTGCFKEISCGLIYDYFKGKLQNRIFTIIVSEDNLKQIDHAVFHLIKEISDLIKATRELYGDFSKIVSSKFALEMDYRFANYDYDRGDFKKELCSYETHQDKVRKGIPGFDTEVFSAQKDCLFNFIDHFVKLYTKNNNILSDDQFYFLQYMIDKLFMIFKLEWMNESIPCNSIYLINTISDNTQSLDVAKKLHEDPIKFQNELLQNNFLELHSLQLSHCDKCNEDSFNYLKLLCINIINPSDFKNYSLIRVEKDEEILKVEYYCTLVECGLKKIATSKNVANSDSLNALEIKINDSYIHLPEYGCISAAGTEDRETRAVIYIIDNLFEKKYYDYKTNGTEFRILKHITDPEEFRKSSDKDRAESLFAQSVILYDAELSPESYDPSVINFSKRDFSTAINLTCRNIKNLLEIFNRFQKCKLCFKKFHAGTYIARNQHVNYFIEKYNLLNSYNDKLADYGFFTICSYDNYRNVLLVFLSQISTQRPINASEIVDISFTLKSFQSDQNIEDLCGSILRQTYQGLQDSLKDDLACINSFLESEKFLFILKICYSIILVFEDPLCDREKLSRKIIYLWETLFFKPLTNLLENLITQAMKNKLQKTGSSKFSEDRRILNLKIILANFSKQKQIFMTKDLIKEIENLSKRRGNFFFELKIQSNLYGADDCLQNTKIFNDEIRKELATTLTFSQ